jgi:squalene cyclase
MIDIAKSVAFIDAKGSSLEKARIKIIASGGKPEPETIQYFNQLQNDDGGFPFGMEKKNISSVFDTLVAFSWMDDLGMLNSPLANTAAQYLFAVQHDDGGWDERPEIKEYDPPPWSVPGDLKARLYLTVDSSFWLAVMDYKTLPGFQKALDFLLKHQDESGKFYGFLHSTWIATAVFALAGEKYSEIVQKGLRFLMPRSPDQWADSQIGWALSCLSKAGLPKTHPFIEKCLVELIKRQKPDGSWSSEDGDTFDVGATIEAVKVLKHYHIWQP